MGKEAEVYHDVLSSFLVSKRCNARRLHHHLVWPQRRISTERYLWSRTCHVIELNLEANHGNTSNIGSIALRNCKVFLRPDILNKCLPVSRLLIVDFDIAPFELYRSVFRGVGIESMARDVSLFNPAKRSVSFLGNR